MGGPYKLVVLVYLAFAASVVLSNVLAFLAYRFLRWRRRRLEARLRV